MRVSTRMVTSDELPLEPLPPLADRLVRREPGIPRPGFVGTDTLSGWRQLAMTL